MSPEFINKEKVKFIIFQRQHLENCEGTFTFKITPTVCLALLFWPFWFWFSALTKLTFSSLFDFRDSCKPGPVTLSAGRGLPAQTPSRKAQLPDQPTCTLGATRIRRPQGSLQMEHQARAHLTVDKE